MALTAPVEQPEPQPGYLRAKQDGRCKGGRTNAGGRRSVLDATLEVHHLVETSPFIDHDHGVGWYEGCKLVVMLPVVVLKWAMLGLAVVYSWAVLVVLTAGHDMETPMGAVRGAIIAAWVKAWASFALLICGFYRIPVKGWANIRAARAARAIVVFNHESYVDPLILGALLPPSGVAKAGVAHIPFISRFAIALQFLFVERRGSSDKSNRFTLQSDPLEAITRRAADPRFPLFFIAPEATTKAQRCLLKFRRGAFSTGQPVVPVLLRYRYTHFNPGWGIAFTPLHVWRLMSQFVNHVSVEVLPPRFPSPQEKKDPMLFAANVRELMASHLNVPLVEQGVADERQLEEYVQPHILGHGCSVRAAK